MTQEALSWAGWVQELILPVNDPLPHHHVPVPCSGSRITKPTTTHERHSHALETISKQLPCHQYRFGFFVLLQPTPLKLNQGITMHHYSTIAAYFLQQAAHVGTHTSPVMSVWEQASQCCWGKQESLSELELCWASCRESVIQQLFLNPSVNLARLYGRRDLKKKIINKSLIFRIIY